MIQQDSGSFRDPSGFIYREKGIVYRQINKYYQSEYDMLMQSGLYAKLVEKKLLISHSEVPVKGKKDPCYKVIKPEIIPFVSYPYEWSFSMLKDAALLTLEIQKTSLESGMSLRDASAYNIQFINGKPMFIDTLSFEHYKKGEPWVAYKQFCQHFLGPLLLMSYKDIRLNQLFKNYIDGIPVDLTASLLGGKGKFNFSIYSHIYLHAKSQKKYEKSADAEIKKGRMSHMAFLGIIDNLESLVKKLTWHPAGTEWGDYYTFTNYSDAGFEHKKEIIGKFIKASKAKMLWDIGGNTGVFNHIAGEMGIETVSFDIDPAAIEQYYLHIKNSRLNKLLPLLQDVTNPSPGIGWMNTERGRIIDRGLPDTLMALALIHHIAISNNVPLIKIAEYFSKMCKHLIIEFVPKEDSQVRILLATREDVFPNYEQKSFEKDFSVFFKIIEAVPEDDSHRTLYLMKAR
jgi:ribosomal protein L11 methylase PrmA